jgi:hypothetical protein
MDQYEPLHAGAPPNPPTSGRPLVFLAKPETVGTARLQGIWVDATLTHDELSSELAGTTLLERYAIIDQVGFGPFMIDEHTNLNELRVLAIGARFLRRVTS